jgi:hypothetical protein
MVEDGKMHSKQGLNGIYDADAAVEDQSKLTEAGYLVNSLISCLYKRTENTEDLVAMSQRISLDRLISVYPIQISKISS